MPSLARSFIAILVGYMVMMLVVIVLTLVFVKTMGLQSGHPTPAYLLINVVYSLLAAGVGGFVTASIVRRKPLEHAAILGAVVLLMGVLSYRHYTGQQPVWYRGMMMILPALTAVAGAALYKRNAPATFL